MLEWKQLWGEWILTGFRVAKNAHNWTRAGMYVLSPYGPPFRYREWDRANKDWLRYTLDHCTTIEEAKACLSTIVRMS